MSVMNQIPHRDSDQQQPGRWGSNKFIIVLALVVAIALLGNMVARMGVNPADTAENQKTAEPAQPPAASDQKANQTVPTPAGTSKDQPADSPKP